jgi:hypothetical protein
MNKAFVSRGAVALAIALLAAEGAWALSFRYSSKVPALVYSPDSVVKGTGTIRVSNGGYAGPFAIVLTQLSLSPSPASPAEGLRYGLYQPAASPTYALSLTGSPSSSQELLLGSFAASQAGKNTSTNVSFAALVSPLSLPPPGTYTASLRAYLYASGFPLSGASVASLLITLSVTVGSHFDLSIAPVGDPFSLAATSSALAFGTLVPGDSRSVDVLVRSNVSYSLGLASAHGGALANAYDGSLVPYALSSNGGALSLSPALPAPLAAGARASYSLAARYALEVRISPFPGLPTEGDYFDTLTLTLSAP